MEVRIGDLGREPAAPTRLAPIVRGVAAILSVILLASASVFLVRRMAELTGETVVTADALLQETAALQAGLATVADTLAYLPEQERLLAEQLALAGALQAELDRQTALSAEAERLLAAILQAEREAVRQMEHASDVAERSLQLVRQTEAEMRRLASAVGRVGQTSVTLERQTDLMLVEMQENANLLAGVRLWVQRVRAIEQGWNDAWQGARDGWRQLQSGWETVREWWRDSQNWWRDGGW